MAAGFVFGVAATYCTKYFEIWLVHLYPVVDLISKRSSRVRKQERARGMGLSGSVGESSRTRRAMGAGQSSRARKGVRARGVGQSGRSRIARGVGFSPLDFPYSAFATSTKMSASSVSSAFVKYGAGPGFVPCFTFPITQSLRVDLGTPNSFAARFTGILRLTSSKAQSIDSFDHCFRFFILIVGV